MHRATLAAREAADQVSVRAYEGKMQLRKVVSGVATTVDFNDVDSPAGDAFGLWARCIGSRCK
jgi:hypothetical protein